MLVRFRSFVAALVFVIVPFGASAAGNDPYTMSVILPLTGPGAFVGQTSQQAFKAGEDEVNRTGGIRGRPLKLQFLDDQTSPQVAVQLTNQVLAAKPAVFLGSELTAMCGAQAPLVANGPVMYCLSPGAHPEAGSYEFSAAVSTNDLYVALMRYCRLSGLTRIALMTPTDASGQDADRGFEQALGRSENAAVKVVDREHFNGADLSVSAQFSRIIAAKPQILIAWAAGTPFGTVLKAYKDNGLTFPMATTTANLSWLMISQYRSILPATLLFSAYPGIVDTSALHLESSLARSQLAYHRSLAANNVKPDNGTGVAWDPLMIVVSALRALGPDASAKQIRDYIGTLRAYAGANGNYNFQQTPQRGLDSGNVLVAKWDDQRQQFIAMSHMGGVPLAVK